MQKESLLKAPLKRWWVQIGTYNTYTAEQEEFLSEHCQGISRAELTAMFNERFGAQKSVSAIKAWCNRRGMNSGSDGRFKKGFVSWQTGLKGEEFKKHYSEDSFQKTQQGLVQWERIHQIGDTIQKSGELWVVVSVEACIPLVDRIVLKRRYVWEQAYGEIPSNHRIIHLDGNKMNCDLENLYCIPSKYIPLLNRNHWLTDRSENTLAAIKWCELYYTLKQRRRTDGR